MELAARSSWRLPHRTAHSATQPGAWRVAVFLPRPVRPTTSPSHHHSNLLAPRPAARRPPNSAIRADGDEEDDDDEDEPYVRERVDIQTSNMPLRSLIDMVDDGSLNLEPDYQRDFVWDKAKIMGLLKTVYEGLPVPAVMLHKRFVEGEGDMYDVVDGKQRLVTLYTFVKGDKRHFRDAHTIILLDPDDELVRQLHGRTFDGLPLEDRRNIQNFTFQVQTIPSHTPPRVVYRIYENINTGGIEHSAQQLRRAAFYGNYIKLLDRLAQYDTFKQLAGLTQDEEKVLQGEELVLRFFAMRRAANVSEKRKIPPSMKMFLNLELQQPDGQRLRKLRAEEVRQMEAVFRDTVELVAELKLKEAAEAALRDSDVKVKSFRRTGSTTGAGPLWDATLVGMSLALDECDRRSVYTRKAEALRARLGALLGSERWTKATSGKLTKKSLAARLLAFREEVVEPVLGKDLTGLQYEPRTFTRADKQQLYDTNSTCAWCGGHIASVDDAEVDHVVPYSAGGRTEKANGQLLHKRCNGEKGARDMAQAPAARTAAAAAAAVVTAVVAATAAACADAAAAQSPPEGSGARNGGSNSSRKLRTTHRCSSESSSNENSSKARM